MTLLFGKRALCLLLLGLLLLGSVACVVEQKVEDSTDALTEGTDPVEDEPQKEEETTTQKKKSPVLTGEGKTIDIYLIAGQSNASGHSRITDKQAILSQYPELERGYSNIYYSGTSRRGGEGALEVREVGWVPARLGLGRTNDSYMGPEAGMAVALSEYYNEESGKYAGIVKYAHGGSSIFNTTSGENYNGNWVCPSYAEELNMPFTGTRGALYRGLLDQVETSIRTICRYDGFTNVNIKGIYWMQGCADRGNTTKYEHVIQLFAADLRRDLSALMMDLTGGISDCGAAEMPFFIGTISETFGAADSGTLNTNRNFITMQKGLASKISKCYVIDNSAHAINRWDQQTGQSVVVGSDKYHWSQADAFAIGQSVGNKLLEVCVPPKA